ncbi:hypothetical protein [Aquamicrobium soli]|uniref:Uncharacterized protein n=1 Tax=Aquamicrobium soli TaxID=1811518 RepID=A0ABV7KI52_9HYPH
MYLNNEGDTEMQTPAAYAKDEVTNGRFPHMTIQAGECGTFWLHDADYRMLDGKAYTSREAAEKARSRFVEKAARWIQ